MGTVFIRAPQATSAYFSRGGVLFFALLFAALTAMAEIPALYAQRPIVVRHQKSALYHPFIEAAALTVSFVTCALSTPNLTWNSLWTFRSCLPSWPSFV